MAGRGEKKKDEEEEEEAAATQLNHPSHPHPLLLNFFGGFRMICDLCRDLNLYCDHIFDTNCYSCTTCDFYAHKQCAEAPSLIPRLPFHPLHPLSLSHDHPSFTCNICKDAHDGLSSFGCDECGFFLDLHCALLTLPYPEVFSEEPIEIPIHPHPLIPSLARRRFHWVYKCTQCNGHIQEEEEDAADAYICLHPLLHARFHSACLMRPSDSPLLRGRQGRGNHSVLAQPSAAPFVTDMNIEMICARVAATA